MIIKFVGVFITLMLTTAVIAQPVIVDLQKTNVLLIGQTTLGSEHVPTRIRSMEEFYRQFGPPLPSDLSKQNMAVAVKKVLELKPDSLRIVKVNLLVEANLTQLIDSIKNLQDVNLIAMPGVTNVSVQIEVAKLAQKYGNCFAIFDFPTGLDAPGMIAHKAQIQSSHATFVAPEMNELDMYGRTIREGIPASEIMLSQIIQMDKTKTPFKAPNQTLAANLRPAVEYRGQVREQLSGTHHINLYYSNVTGKIGLSSFRTANTTNLEDRYISVVRLRSHLQKTIERGTAWIIFEPNNEVLWQRIRMAISNYLMDVFRRGWLVGRAENEAFYVRAGLGTTMTNDDLLNERTRAQVGVALMAPAEFSTLTFLWRRR